MAKLSRQDVLDAKIHVIFNGFENYEAHFGKNSDSDDTITLYLNRNTDMSEEVQCLEVNANYVTDEIDIMFYTMYLVLKISRKNIIENYSMPIDRELYLCHSLVRYFGVNFVIYKILERKNLWGNELVNFIIDSIKIAFMKWPYSFYYHGNTVKILINDNSYDLEAYCGDNYPQKLLDYNTTFIENIFSIVRFYWYAYKHSISQEVFAILSKELGENYRRIRI